MKKNLTFAGMSLTYPPKDENLVIIASMCEELSGKIQLPSNLDIMNEAERVADEVKTFNFDSISFQYGAQWMRGIITEKH